MSINYVESLDVFGVPIKEIPCITKSGRPTESTIGAVGLFYMDTDTGVVYKCTSVANGVYTWEEFGGGTSGGTADLTEVNKRIDAISKEIADLNIGQPITVSLVAKMTDTSKVYLYTGAEEGYTSGNWYYHDGSVWVSGGKYGSSGVMTANAKALFRTLLMAAVYDSDVLTDPATTIEAFLAELNNIVVPDSGGDTGGGNDSVGEPEEPVTTYTVTYNLTGITSSNTATSVTEGGSYTTVLTGTAAIDSVTVKMGGVDITETAYNSTSGMITISEVTGNIEITAAIADPSLLYSLKDASFNGQTIVDTGVALFDEPKDFTILFDFENAFCGNKSPILGLVEDDTITDSYQHFYVCTDIIDKNADTETIKCYGLISRSKLIDFPSQSADANNRGYYAKFAMTFDSTSNKWTAKVLNMKTGESTENTLTNSVITMPNNIAIGGSNYRGKTAFTCNELSVYNRILSADEISAWMQ